MNPDNYLNEAKKRYLNSDYMVKVKEYTQPEDDYYNNFIFKIATEHFETPEERKKRIHKENIKRKLKEF